ncbi:BON domain-containing protein [Myxococcus sp. RHSTA-1-4]|uniref:BON domain-containing protein n=1 Tax=Myxococcus sp. RHSTA-1-4 TaxID=2874601 RepID=UPI001CBD112C|nr:BON domain-containing protein [Myxococcus sp. RHSTA-1-4]MBZ4420133.1 BON domain-containing protein [Myxococcus sp. RHSTA-1-4]
MANRRYEDSSETWNPEGRQGRRPGGGYGLGGAQRGYNQGGWGPSSYEEGYQHRSYDRLLDATGRAPRERGEGLDVGARRFGMERPHALGKAPRGYVRPDERIREDICERLIDSPYDASDVDVQVKQGEVTLSGTVKSRQERRDIEDLVVAVRGVHDVFNRIRVAEGDTGRRLHS